MTAVTDCKTTVISDDIVLSLCNVPLIAQC